jgi:tetratricopeptide (TPR) repeat protein/transcriptional regulator with XRE-family HTH domain
VGVSERPAASFGQLLRELRLLAGLTQEELAEQAQLHPRSVSDLERGINRSPRGATARLLADALKLDGPARARFEAAARERTSADARAASADPVGSMAAATRTLPRDIGSFTGREAELRQLLAAVKDTAARGTVGVYVIGGMAGIGKTAVAVHAAHQLGQVFPDGQIFLPLHGHTPGQLPVHPADALESLLLTAGLATRQIPPGLEARTRLWRDHLAGRRLLLVLDDAAGHEQVRPLLPGTAGNAVLVTSRRHLTGLEDATAISLDTLQPSEAAELLIRLAARPGLTTADAAVAEITRLCGFLPLAVGMLARQLHHHPAWTATELAAYLGSARDLLGLMRAEDLSVASAFDLSYRDLTIDQQRLFRRLGLHPGTDIDAYTAAALDATDLAAARRQLEVLYDQYLLAETARGRYRMHDLILEHARTLAFAESAAEREAAVGRLSDFYLHTARIADQHLARRPRVEGSTTSAAACVPDLRTPNDAAAWMDAEHVNLRAVAAYAALHERPRHAIAIAVAMFGFLRSRGYWEQAVALHRSAVDAARHAGDQLAEAGALIHLGDAQRLTDDYQAAAESLTQAAALCRDLRDPLGEASALSELGAVQFFAADYQASAASYKRALELSRSVGDQLGEASALNELGCVEYMTGNLPTAAADVTDALRLFRQLADQHGEAHALNHLSMVQQATGDGRATDSLTRALDLYRQLGDRLGEGEALHRLGVMQHATGDHLSASASLTHALKLYRDLRSQLGEAEVLNSMGDLSLASTSPDQARAHYERALVRAAGIPAPFEEARALEGIGRCQLRDGQPGKATASLRQALAIYERIGSSNAGRIRTILNEDAASEERL